VHGVILLSTGNVLCLLLSNNFAVSDSLAEVFALMSAILVVVVVVEQSPDL